MIMYNDHGKRGTVVSQSTTMLVLIVILALSGKWSLRAADKIIIKDGRFVNSITDKRFMPIGFNYNRLRPHPMNAEVLWHDNFNPKTYDRQQVRTMFKDLQQHEFNVVRVFLDPMDAKHGGIFDPSQPDGFSKLYLANLVDFIRAAGEYSVYAIVTVGHSPQIPKARELRERDSKSELSGLVSDRNRGYLLPGEVKAFSIYLIELLTRLKVALGKEMNNILAVETRNEVYLMAGSPPFSNRKGTFEYLGKTYLLDNDDDLQALSDAAVINWQNSACDAIKTVDSNLLVGTSVFTFAAVGRHGPGSMLKDKTPDKRTPARPMALVKAKIDYLDIHMYMAKFEGESCRNDFAEDLASVEWKELKSELKEKKIPVIMGEFGANLKRMKTVDRASYLVVEHAELALAEGFQGFMYWTYDAFEQNATFLNAKHGSGIIFKALADLKSRIRVSADGDVTVKKNTTYLAPARK